MKTNNLMLKKYIVGASILFLGSLATSAIANGNCQNFTLTSNVTLLSPTGPAIGTATATMDDGTIMQVMAEGDITSTKISDEGIIHMRVTELDTWGPLGTTIGLDRLKLTPTAVPGEYALNIKTFIEGDTGLLEDVFGHYKGEGSVSFSTGQLHHSGSGKICNLPF